MTTTVYTKDNCQGCKATIRFLDGNDIPYVTKNVDTDEKAREKVMALGFMQMPVVVTPTDSWFGYRPDKLVTVPGYGSN